MSVYGFSINGYENLNDVESINYINKYVVDIDVTRDAGKKTSYEKIISTPYKIVDVVPITLKPFQYLSDNSEVDDGWGAPEFKFSFNDYNVIITTNLNSASRYGNTRADKVRAEFLVLCSAPSNELISITDYGFSGVKLATNVNVNNDEVITIPASGSINIGDQFLIKETSDFISVKNTVIVGNAGTIVKIARLHTNSVKKIANEDYGLSVFDIQGNNVMCISLNQLKKNGVKHNRNIGVKETIDISLQEKFFGAYIQTPEAQFLNDEWEYDIRARCEFIIQNKRVVSRWKILWKRNFWFPERSITMPSNLTDTIPICIHEFNNM